MNAVANSGPLIVLAKLGCLSLLPRLYAAVLVPQAVYNEAVVAGQRYLYPDAAALRAFLDGQGWKPTQVQEFPAFLESDIVLGTGERQVLALAWVEHTPALIDETQARTMAKRVGIATVGSLGILVSAYHQGILTAMDLDGLLAVVEKRQDIWIHPELCALVRRKVLER